MDNYNSKIYLNTINALRLKFVLYMAFAFTTVSSVSVFSENYNGVIYYDPEASSTVIAAATDMADLLKEATSNNFSLTTSPPSGAAIMLVEQSSSMVPDNWAATLNQHESYEAYLLRSASGKLWIVAKNELGLQAGIYSYLKLLGFKFYYPGDNWKIVPIVSSIEVTIDKVDAPVFVSRNFFGTGGLGPKMNLDTSLSQIALWELYQKRNRFGGVNYDLGHSGLAFNQKYENYLTNEHPEYLAFVDGTRQPWSDEVKCDYSNPEFIDFYTQDRVSSAKMYGNIMLTGVEPADGGGYCECDRCLALAKTQYGLNNVEVTNVTDRVFHLSNQTAIAMNETYPIIGGVSLYAYFQHLMPPHIPVEPNTFVTVIPYGFNYTGIQGDDLLYLWSEKLPPRHMGIYDYWAVTDWSLCKPDQNLAKRVAQLKFWNDVSVGWANFESSYSAGSIGLLMWLASNIMWDPAVNTDELLDTFYADCFNGSKVPIRRMMERWSNFGFEFSENDVALGFKDLQEAMTLADSPAEKRRIQDYVVYLQYLRLMYECNKTTEGSADRLAAVDKVMTHMWRIYSSAMVHTYRMWMLIFNIQNPGATDLKTKWDPVGSSSHWSTIKPYSDEEIDKLLLDGVQDYTTLSFEHITYNTENLIPLFTDLDYSATDRITTAMLYRSHDFVFKVPEGVSEFVLPYNGNGTAYISVKNDTGHIVFSQKTTANTDWINLTMDIGPGRYSMTIGTDKFFSLQVPRKMPFVTTRYTPYSYYDKNVFDSQTSDHACVYIPEGVNSIGIKSASADDALPTQIFNQDDKLVSPDNPQTVFEVIPPTSHKGLIWYFRSYGGDAVKFYSVPNVFSFSPEGMMVPNSSATEVQSSPSVTNTLLRIVVNSTNSTTRIVLINAETGIDVQFSIYDISGRLMHAVESKKPVLIWNNSRSSSGIYLIRASQGQNQMIGKVVLH